MRRYNRKDKPTERENYGNDKKNKQRLGTIDEMNGERQMQC